MCCVEDAAQAQAFAAQGTYNRAHVPIVGRVAANAPYTGAALGEPCPITFATCHHTVASRREDELPRAALNEQPRRQQSEAAQAAREEVHTVSRRHRCSMA